MNNPSRRGEVSSPASETTLADLRHDLGTWQKAADAWLASFPSPNTRRIYTSAHKSFFHHCPKPPWEISGADLIAWQKQLTAAGLSPATVNNRLAALSSFYTYCTHRYTLHDPSDGRDHPLALHNPAQRPQRAPVRPYRQSIALTLDQARQLLRAIDRSSPAGLRDYALVAGYLLTGFRSTELRTLRWGALQRAGDLLTCTWTGKGGKADRESFPWAIYHLIVDYLKAAERWPLQDHQPIFVALSDVAVRLPHVDQHHPDRPLSSSAVNRLVKRAARRAGLSHLPITTHTLRHTAAMLRKEHTDDLQELQRFLHHASLSTTQLYLDHLTVKPDQIAPHVANQLGIR